MKKKIQDLRRRRQEKKESKADASVPRITNENVAQHREDVLSGARKYIYPLQHSKHRIVLLSTSIFLVVVLLFSVSTVLLLYRFQSTSGIMYGITRVLPFPIARSGSTFIAYENYLFELNHYTYYYENQQQLSFETEAGRDQLNSYKERAINKVVNDAYVKIIAREKGLSVSVQEVDEQIRIAREQNRLGGNDDVYEDVLQEYWNWTLNDFRRSLQTELLAQKVIRALDTETENRAKEVLQKIQAGGDFAALAKEYSQDIPTKDEGGEFGEVSKSNRNVPQQTVDTLYKVGNGQISGIVVVPYGPGYALSIIKNLGIDGDKVRGAHIILPLKDINEVLNDRKEEQPYRLYMNPVSEKQ